MGGQQSEIFARYRSLFNSKSVKPYESESSRKVDNMDFVDFLFELVRATKGQKQFKNVILKGSLSKIKKTEEINQIIKKAFISKFACDNSLLIPTKYTTKSTQGIDIDKNQIDAFGMFGIDPDSSPGNYVYEGNNPSKHVNYVLYKAQGATDQNPMVVNYNGNVLFSVYAKSSNTMNFKFGEFYENKTYGTWLNDYLALIDPIFNFVNFTTILTDIITGAISIKANKNKLEVKQESGVIKALQKMFGFCSEAPVDSSVNSSANEFLKNQLNQDSNFNGDNVTGTVTGLGNNTTTNNGVNDGTTDGVGENDDDPFDFDFTDLEEIESESNLRSKGQVRFSTCNNLDIDFDPDAVLAGLDALFKNADNNEFYSYDNSDSLELSNTTTEPELNADGNPIYDNSTREPNLDQATNFFDDALKQGAGQAIADGEDDVAVDMANMNAEMQLNILKAIPYALMQMILSPKILLVPKLYSVLNNEDDSGKSVNDFIKSMGNTIKTIGAAITALLVKNIFDSIKADLAKLAKDLAKRFITQRGIDYLSTFKSLIGLLGLFGGSGGGCGGVLNSLLKLLKLSNFGPMPMIPPPLILVGGALKQGLNQVSIYNDVKSKLTEKGIETAPTLPDGSPNNMMIAIEETINTIIGHIKTNASIQTFAIGATGPVQGYGQIQ